MDDLIFLAHRLPYPPDKGDKIRSWNLLRHLAKTHRIHLGAFIDDPADEQHVPFLQLLCASTHFETLNPKRARLRSARGLFRGEALSFPYYRHAGMHGWVNETIKRVKPSVAFAYSSQIAPYILSGSNPEMARIIDFVDVDSDKWRQYAESKSFPLSWIYDREARLLAEAETQLAWAADASLFVSEAEASLFRQRVGLRADRVMGIGNGVDQHFFNPGLPAR
jgi:sugar transferase (PEP-CTERM/EpsH1 system associated)